MADKKKQEKKPAYQRSSIFEAGSELKRKNPTCPKCGKGTYLAVHKNRKTCGKCSYMEVAAKA